MGDVYFDAPAYISLSRECSWKAFERHGGRVIGRGSEGYSLLEVPIRSLYHVHMVSPLLEGSYRWMDLGCLKCDACQDCVVDDGDLWGSEPANMRHYSLVCTFHEQTSVANDILPPPYSLWLMLTTVLLWTARSDLATKSHLKYEIYYN